MKELMKQLEKWRQLKLSDEDGNDLSIETRKGLSEPEFLKFEERYSIELPNSLKTLLSLSDGLVLFGIEILPLHRQLYHEDQRLLAFHEWGNGDFDCLRLSEQNSEVAPVFFMNHSPNVTAKVCDSLSEWMCSAVDEVRHRGVLLHPSDYKLGQYSSGVYLSVLSELLHARSELSQDP